MKTAKRTLGVRQVWKSGAGFRTSVPKGWMKRNDAVEDKLWLYLTADEDGFVLSPVQNDELGVPADGNPYQLNRDGSSATFLVPAEFVRIFEITDESVLMYAMDEEKNLVAEVTA